MNFNKLINANLDKAFRLLRDLAKPAVLNLKSGNSFDFGVGEVVHAQSQSLSIKVVVIESKKVSKSHSAQVQNLLMRKKEVSNLSDYDTVVFSGNTWNIGPLLKDTGNILLVEITREATNEQV